MIRVTFRDISNISVRHDEADFGTLRCNLDGRETSFVAIDLDGNGRG